MTHIYTTHVIQCTTITCIQSISISHDQNIIGTHTNPCNNHQFILYQLVLFNPFFVLNTCMHTCTISALPTYIFDNREIFSPEGQLIKCINTTPDTIKILLLKCFTLWLLSSRVPITNSNVNATNKFKLSTYVY